MIDDSHAIVSSAHGPEYYVSIYSFVDKDKLDIGSSVLLHNKVHAVVGILADDADPMVSVMKVEKAPLESYADIGGLHDQIQEIKEAVEMPLTHPELYEEIGIKPPKGVVLYGEPGTGKVILHIYIHTHIHTHLHTQIHTFTHTHTHTHTYTIDASGQGRGQPNISHISSSRGLGAYSKVSW